MLDSNEIPTAVPILSGWQHAWTSADAEDGSVENEWMYLIAQWTDHSVIYNLSEH